jgi:hypothetical protein
MQRHEIPAQKTVIRRLCAALLACTLIAACSKDTAKATGRTNSKVKTDDSAAGSVDLGESNYKPGTVTAVGTVRGTIKLDGPPPSDSTTITKDEEICGTKASSAYNASAKGLGGAIVWIVEPKTGKPLPMEKRTQLSSEKCALDPRVQAVVVGTTVNVFNDDKLIHRLVFLRAGTNDTLQVLRYFNDGQVVPSEKLAKTPGVVEVRCVQHPWTHAYIAVFDHPYFAVTDDDGSFKIDSLPPGTYTANVWHEGMTKPMAQQIQVAANGTATLDLAIKPGR